MLPSLHSAEAAAFCPCVAAKIGDQQLIQSARAESSVESQVFYLRLFATGFCVICSQPGRFLCILVIL